MKNRFGITERGDAGLDQSWRDQANSCDGIVLITKSPQLLADAPLPGHAIVHCTITGHGGNALEPGVASQAITVPAYRRLLDRLGPERCVLRIDPIIPTDKGLETALSIFKHAGGRVRISFMDAYPHVQKRLRAAGLPELPTGGEVHFPLEIRQQAAAMFPGAEICSEPGLACIGCISGRDYRALGLEPPLNAGRKGQRSACNCLATKTELLSGRRRCAHACLYCYWR